VSIPPTPPRAKRVLYHGPSPEAFSALIAALQGSPGCTLVSREPPTLEHEGSRCAWVPALDPGALLDHLQHEYVNLVVLDLRGPATELAARAARAVEVLEALDRREDVEDRFAFHRTLVLVSGAATPELDAVILRLGGLGVGRVLRAPEAPRAGPPSAEDVTFAAGLSAEVRRILFARRTGKRAVCAAGGGTTGLFFELGTLKCLDDCLGDGGVGQFDMYFGISAGAVACGPLAVGYSVDEYMAAIAGVEGGRMPPIDLRLFRLGHLDAQGLRRRVQTVLRTTAAGVWSAMTGRAAPTKEALLFEYADLVAPPFRGDGFEAVLRQILTAPGATNAFRQLTRPLFVGATDQDRKEHVLFGDEEHADVPISLAIQASLSLNPAFSATPIDGRYFEDGAVTRTSNFVEAIRRGATLILVLDPFVPYIARAPGFANEHGILYNLDQDIRTVSYTRYENTRNWVLRNEPEVSAYTFVPANRLRRLMSLNPMDHRPYLEIWQGAYLSTLSRLRRVEHRLGGDFAAHGLHLDLERASVVAAQLEATMAPGFSDFFPERRVAIRQRPLCREVGGVAT